MSGQLDDLDLLLAAARDEIVPSATLTARVLADAAALQPAAAAVRKVPERGWLAGLLDLFGGGGVVAGMSAVTATGLFLGFVQPSGLASLTLVLHGGGEVVDTVELIPGTVALWTEE